MDDRKWFKFVCLQWPDFVRHQPSKFVPNGPKFSQEWCSAPTTTANQRTISESVMIRARAVQIVPGMVRQARFSYKSNVTHGHGLQIVPEFVPIGPKFSQEWLVAPTTTANHRTISESVMIRARAVQIVPGMVKQARFAYKSIVTHGHGLQIVPENGKFHETYNKILWDINHGIGTPLARGATTRKMATRVTTALCMMMTSSQAVPLKVNQRRLWLRSRERTKTTYFTCSNLWFLKLELTVKWSLGCIYRRK